MHILYGANFNTSLKAINTPKYNLAYMKTWYKPAVALQFTGDKWFWDSWLSIQEKNEVEHYLKPYNQCHKN